MAMNSQQTRVTDNHITSVLWGVKTGHDLVGTLLFPYVNISRTDTKVLKFTARDFELINSVRAPGSQFKSVEVEYESETVSFIQDGLVSKVPIERIEETATLVSVGLQEIASIKTLKLLLRSLEKEHAGLATNTANYSANNTLTLTGTDQFNDYDASTPEVIIEDAREAIRDSVGVYPNVGVISAKAFRALKHHPTYLEQIKYTSSKTLTVDMLRDIWELKQLRVGTAIWTQNGTKSDMWGKDIILAYTAPDAINAQDTKPNSATDESEPSFGYTYRQISNPLARPYRFDENDESWKSNTIFNRRSYIVGKDAGFLIKNAVA